MPQAPATSIAALLEPLTPEEFFRDSHRQKPIHIKGAPDKFSGVADWDTVSGFLSQAGIWTANSLEMAFNGKKVETRDYCLPGPDRDNRPNLLADLARVKNHLKQGASLVLNDVTTLAPGIAQIAETLGRELAGKVQANLYCSWQACQAFGTHYDVHDVWAIHLAGRKTWNLYQRHFENPIPHPKFRNLGPEFHKTHHGPVSATLIMEPGDLLYIPRGWYHDALAESEATLHIAFGVTPLIGLDVITHLFEEALDEPALRADLPAPDGAERKTEQDLQKALTFIAQKIGSIATGEAFRKRIMVAISAQRPLLEEIRLPDLGESTYLVKNKGISVFSVEERAVLGNSDKAAPIPPGMEAATRWILEQNQFTESDFTEKFPAIPTAAKRQFLRDLCAMRVLVTR